MPGLHLVILPAGSPPPEAKPGVIYRVAGHPVTETEAKLLAAECGAGSWELRGDWIPAAEAARPLVAPARGMAQAYEGHRPWLRHGCEIWIPVIDPMESLPLVLDLLRAQTVRPYIVLVDTGSRPDQWEQVQALRAPDLEVHAIWTGGLRHSSAVVASALDLAMSVAGSRTEKLLFTHSDCFPARRDAVEILCSWLSPDCPAVGYGITPRENAADWERFLGHVWAGLYLPKIRETRARWGHTPEQSQAAWDTEYSFNRLLAADGIRPVLLGWEENWQVNTTADYTHVRSFPLSGLYVPTHRAMAEDWMTTAKAEAWERLESWKITES